MKSNISCFRSITEVRHAEMSSEELLKEVTALEEKVECLKAENESLRKKEYDVDNQIETIEVSLA